MNIKKVIGWFSKYKKQQLGIKEISTNDEALKVNDAERKVVSKALVVYSSVGYFAMLPTNFNLEMHLLEYPPHEYGFRSNYKFDTDKILVILGLLYSIPTNNGDLIIEDDFVPIYAKALRDHLKDYPLYMDYLLNTGVIECDEIYFEGRAMRYRWTNLYRDVPLKERFMRRFDPKQVNPILKKDGNTLENYPYLSYWLNNKLLKFDSVLAVKYAKEYKVKKDQGGKETWDINKKTNELIKPQKQYDAAIGNVTSFSIHDYKAQINPHVHRLYSILTNISKAYRNFVTYDQQQLVAIDIKNCQPYLSCILFNPDFWANDSQLYLNFNQLPQNIVELIRFTPPKEKVTSILVELDKYLKGLNGNEFEEYKELVSSGQLYEKVIDWVYKETRQKINREDAKIAIFVLIYSPNRYNRDNPNYWLMHYYKDRFPEVIKVFSIIKHQYHGIDEEKQHARFSCLLQAIESEIVLHRCCKRIWEQGNKQIPIFTVHDSIVTTIDNVDFVRSIMEDEIFKCVGLPPKLEPQQWNYQSKDLDQEIIKRIIQNLN